MISTKTYLDEQQSNLQLIIDYFESLKERFDINQINWRMDDTAWSIGQCCHHIILVNRYYLDRSKEKIDATVEANLLEESPFRSGYLGNMMISLVGAHNGFKLKSPSLFEPENTDYKTSIFSEILLSLEEVKTMIESSSGLDLNKIKIDSPDNKLMRFRLGDVFKILIDHCERHMNQIKELAGSALFPLKNA